MQICVFPVFTFPRIVNKTDVVFMVSIVIVCSYYHCCVQVGPAHTLFCWYHSAWSWLRTSYSWTLNLDTLKQTYPHLKLNLKLYNTHNSQQWPTWPNEWKVLSFWTLNVVQCMATTSQVKCAGSFLKCQKNGWEWIISRLRTGAHSHRRIFHYALWQNPGGKV